MNPIKHRFVALDYMNGRLHHVDESNPAADWTVPSGGTLQDMQLAGNGQLIVSMNDGWSFRRLADGSEVSRVKTTVVGIAALRLLAGGGVLAGVNTNTVHLSILTRILELGTAYFIVFRVRNGKLDIFRFTPRGFRRPFRFGSLTSRIS